MINFGTTRVVYPVQRELNRSLSASGDEGSGDQHCVDDP